MMDKIDEIVVHGYLRQHIGIDFEDIPHDIIRLIWKWSYNCFVHLIARKSGKHWKMLLSKIL